MSDDTAAAELKDRHRTMWASGDYPELATLVEDVGIACAAAAEVEPGMDLLDVATGTGNLALAAAKAGANVTGLDLVEDLIDVARRRADEAGVSATWLVGDAEDLPIADESMDRVTSAIGIQFAPRHEVVARELNRVLKPGGRMVLGNWTRSGLIGAMFTLNGEYAPKPPPFVSPPPLWGDEEHVRSLFESSGMDLSFHARDVVLPFGSADEYMTYFETKYGPTMTLKAALEPAGRWEEYRARLGSEVLERFQTPDGFVQEFFVISGDKPA